MKTVAIVGATGLVGEKLLDILSSANTDVRYVLYASEASAGKKIFFNFRNYTVRSVRYVIGDAPNYAVFVSDNETAAKYVPLLIEHGTVCIDNSSCFRMEKDVPLVVPYINKEDIKGNLIANPNCTTIQIVSVLNPLKKFKLKRVVASTYQAASGAGKKGIIDLAEKRGYGALTCFKHPIYDNVIPAIGEFQEGGKTDEEWKVIYESRKILQLPDLKIDCFAVRVPVTVGHGVYLNIEFDEQISPEKIRQTLKKAENVIVADDPENNIYPMPEMTRGTPLVFVGRVTADPSNPTAADMFVTADNLMRGAAYNAYEILRAVYKEQ